MAAAGSSYALRLPNPVASNDTVASSCVSSGLVRRDGDTSTSSISGCCFSIIGMRKILKKYHQSALQPIAQTVWSSKRRTRRLQVRVFSAPLEEGVTVHDMPLTKSNNDSWDDTRKMLDASLDFVATDSNLMQALHEAARMFQMAIEKQRSLTKGPWFAKAWLGIDHNAWIKSIAYQAAVHALIQAGLNLVRRREGKGLVACAIVQQRLLHLCSPLEESIRQHLSSRDPDAEEWLWYQQHPVVVTKFTSNLENDPRFTAVAILDWQGSPQFSNKELDVTFFMLALSICAAIMKLGPGKISCSDFSLELAEETGRLMESLVEYSSIDQVYHFTSSVGLRSEFFTHFGPRAAADKSELNLDERERLFWIELVQQSVIGALAREGVRSKLSSFGNIEVLEQDLAVFGFFTALGRRARSFLATQEIELDDSILSLLRYLEGGCVLFFPPLAALTTYQLFVEVVCEELAWIPFFQEYSTTALTHGNMRTDTGNVDQHVLQEEGGEAVATVLNVCSYWVDEFKMHSKRIGRVKTAGPVKFLSNIQSRLFDCIAASSRGYRQDGSNKIVISRAAMEVERTLKHLLFENLNYKDIGEKSKILQPYQTGEWGEMQEQSLSMRDEPEDINLVQLEEQLKFFDEDLKTVEEVLFKLEGLLKESELSRLQNGRIHLTAIRMNLWKIRRLKKEAEALEVSLKEKASSKEKVLNQAKVQQAYDSQKYQSCDSFNTESFEDHRGDGEMNFRPQRSRIGSAFEDATNIAQELAKKLPFLPSTDRDTSQAEDDAFDMAAAVALDEAAAVSKEVAQFEILCRELIQLDSRIRGCAGEMSSENDSTRALFLKDKNVEKGKVWDFLSRSTKKFKNASLDVLKGTQLLATDVAVAVSLLKSSILGHELTDRERKTLRRTCTDLASVIPIGFLMLLPVTAVGHAAMLAAIQKYVPALIPSAYAPERLNLLKQLEQLKAMEAETTGADVYILTDITDTKGSNFKDTRAQKQE